MSNVDEIAVSYDVSNEFFRVWLDERQTYSSALFLDTDDLDEAQLRKLHWIADAAGVSPGCHVLDVGCGWGGNLEFLVEERGAASATGITLSAAQHQCVRDRGRPSIEVEKVCWTEYQPARLFDAVTSIGMFEHVATHEETRTGAHRDIYRRFFHRAWEWTRPGARFGLQTVVTLRTPRDAEALERLAFVSHGIFPGATAPRLEAVVESSSPSWEVQQIQMRRSHYARTLEHWRERLGKNESLIRRRFGDARFEEYDRYLEIGAWCFHEGYQSLAQLELRRADRRSARSESKRQT